MDFCAVTFTLYAHHFNSASAMFNATWMDEWMFVRSFCFFLGVLIPPDHDHRFCSAWLDEALCLGGSGYPDRR